MPNGFTIISSILKALEDALLCLQDLAFGATPGIRYLFPWCSGGDPVLRITFDRIINVVTFKTDPACILRVSWHFPLTPVLVKRISPVFPQGI
jgi:hypothetical protein